MKEDYVLSLDFNSIFGNNLNDQIHFSTYFAKLNLSEIITLGEKKIVCFRELERNDKMEVEYLEVFMEVSQSAPEVWIGKLMTNIHRTNEKFDVIEEYTWDRNGQLSIVKL